MFTKIMKVFYGKDNLPYKDQERQVHFPITGGSFLGASNVTEIRFYIDQIGDSSDTWVANAKLPNGKMGSKILQTFTDTELGEHYAKLDFSSYYTQAKGDVYISLNGFYGGVQITETGGVYSIEGIPTIQATGVVKIAVNYATPLISGDEVETITLQQIFAMFGTKLNKNDNRYLKVVPTSASINTTANQEIISAGDIVYAIDEGTVGIVTGTYPNYTLGNAKIFAHEVGGAYADFEVLNVAISITVPSFNAIQDENEKQLPTWLTENYVDRSTNQDINGKKTFNDETLFSDSVVFDEDADFESKVRLADTIIGYLVPETTNNANIGTSSNRWKDLYLSGNIDFNGALKSGNISMELVDIATKDYVSSVIQTIRRGQFQQVDIEEYPTLQDFLDDFEDYEEGIIYLYPINTSDPNEGYYEYTHEDDIGWVLLGATTINLGNYYTIAQTNNLLSYKADKSDTYTKNEVDNLLDDKQDLIDSSNKLASDLVDDTNQTNKFVTTQEKAQITTNTNKIQELEEEVDDHSDLLAELKSIVCDNIYPAVVDYEIEYATYFALPNSIDGDPLIFGAGTDLTELKGNSVVVNQLVQNGDFSNGTTGWTTSAGTTSVSNNICSATFISNGDKMSQQIQNAVAGHTYYLSAYLKANDSSSSPTLIEYISQSGTFKSSDTPISWQKVEILFTPSTLFTAPQIQIRNTTAVSSTDTTIQIRDVQLADLTQAFPTDTPTSVDDPRVQWLIQYLTDHPELNTGSIIDSKLLKVVSKGANIWDEETELGSINLSTGANESGPKLRSKNYISVFPNTSYACNNSTSGKPVEVVCFYDKDKNYLGKYDDTPITFITPNNCYYIRFRTDGSYGTTYNHDICINISNSAINGKYIPHIADKEYPLTSPVDMKSVRNVQDTKDSSGLITRNVGSYTFTGSESWQDRGTNSAGSQVYSLIITNSVLYALKIDTQSLSNKAVYKGTVSGASVVTNGNDKKGYYLYYNTESNDRYIYVVGLSNVELNGLTIYFELATPYTEQGTPLPQDISIQKGGSLEFVYDDNAQTPSDVKLEFAVSKVGN